MDTRDWRREFEEVALIHLDSLFHKALRLCRNRSDAEDLVQESYLRAFRHFDHFEPGTNCRAWLFTILHNTFINWVTRQHRCMPELDGGNLESVDGEGLEIRARIANPYEELLRRVAGAQLLGAIERLPATFRHAIWLADVQDCSYKEVAQICQVPLGTVMSRLFRGRQRLRKTLQPNQRACL